MLSDVEAELHDRIQKALDHAADAVYDSDHHKMYVIDQMVRALTGCPMVMKNGVGSITRKPYIYQAQGESDEYHKFIAMVPEWDEGVAP